MVGCVATPMDAPAILGPQARVRRPDQGAGKTLRAVEERLWLLGEDWVNALDGKTLGLDPEEWRRVAFSQSEIASWDAALIARAAASPCGQKRGPGRI